MSKKDKKKVYKEATWDDDSVGYENASDHIFRLERGYIDVIRIVGEPVEFVRHYIDEKGFYVIPEADDTTLEDKGYKPIRTWACKIIHIARIKNKKREIVGVSKVWVFSDVGKHSQIKEFQDTYGALKAIELRITCIDTKFQKVGAIIPVTKDSGKQLMTKDMIAEFKENGAGLFDKVLVPKSKKDILDILKQDDDDDVSDESDDVDLEDDDEIEETSKKKGKKKEEKKKDKKGKKKKESEVDDDDDLGDSGSDDDEESDDDLDSEIEDLLDDDE